MSLAENPLTEASGRVGWHLIHTRSRQEFRAVEHLRNQGFRCSLPLIRLEKLVRGKRVVCSEPLFPRYLFVYLDAATPQWGVIRSTRGVSSLVTFGGVPALIPSGWLSEFERRCLEPRRLFECGQRVRIEEGAFAGLEGIYELDDGDSRAVILLTLLNRECRGVFPLRAIKAAD